jgi:cytochrome c-type biogenesis protein
VSDVVGFTIDLAAQRAGWATAAAFAAGIATSFGPCVAPRFVAVASLSSQAHGAARWLRIAAFVGGLCASFVLLGTIAGGVGLLARYATWVYAALAIATIAAGIRAIVTQPQPCAAGESTGARASNGAAFLAGAGLTAIASPCCGPVAAALAAAATAGGSPLFAATTLAAFALGHAVPVVAIACGASSLARWAHAHIPAWAVATVSGALMVALGGYYGLLA